MREDDGIRFRHMLDAAREAVEFSQFPFAEFKAC